MPLVHRYLETPVTADLTQKMVFLAGPRQVGKTTVARTILGASQSGIYLSWDNDADRRTIRSAEWPADEALVVLDELHKYRLWKRWLKGEYDRHGDRLRFLVTGSARLDIYRRGGDSLQGRYHHYRLHPFTAAEMQTTTPAGPAGAPGAELRFTSAIAQQDIELLLRFGGFPEPLLAQSERIYRRWRKERVDRFFREDVRELEQVRELSALQLLADLLTDRVGSPLSINALREDLEVSHRAVDHWVDILDRLYYLFRIRPYATRLVRAVRKMRKGYLWDWSGVTDPGARFENLIASHLLKFCHFLQDHDGYQVELKYVRDTAGHEIDFLVTHDRKPWFAVEAKLSQSGVAPALRYYRERLGIPFVYQVALDGTRDYEKDGVRVLPARLFLSALT